MTQDAYRSTAGWSEGSAAPLVEEVELAPRQRYRFEDRLAVGGMGEVLVCWDEVLQREVALKRLSEGEPGELAREARITSRLQHPGIVPIFDAGTGPDGRAFYVMQMIRGRSLHEAIDAGEGLMLLRPFLGVCEAIAYAHSRGVVHRDLKPRNVMLGEFGEAVVVDWGLAQRIGEPGGAIVGTRPFMSPEQAAAAPPAPGDDVFALGRILAELVRDDGGPDELRAIVERATARRREERYPDASALRDEVARFLDGGRVAAYDYSPGELARRFVRAFRLPLAIGLVALVAVAGIGVAGYRGVAAERANVEAAERQTRGALATTEQTLGRVLEHQSVAALLAGHRVEAEVLAAHALGHHESPDARGVLMAARAGGLERADWRAVPLEGCGEVLSVFGGRVLCRGEREVVVREIGGGEVARRATVPVAGQLGRDGWVLTHADGRVEIVGWGGETLAELELGSQPLLAWSPQRDTLVVANRQDLRVVALVTGPVQFRAETCQGSTIEAVAASTARVAVACGDGRVRLFDRRATDLAPLGPPIQTPFGGSRRRASAMALSSDGRSIAVGSLQGEAMHIDATTGAVSPVWRASVSGAVRSATFIDATRVALALHPGQVSLWDLRSGSELMVLPRQGGARVSASDGRLWVLGETLHSLTLDEAPAPFRFASPEGLAQVAVGSQWVVAARGDGVVSAWGIGTGRRVVDRSVADAVVKSVALDSTGTDLVFAVAGMPASGVLDVASGAVRPHASAPRSLRRVGWLRDAIVAAHYGPGLFRWRDGMREEVPLERAAIDLAGTPDRSAAWLLLADGAVARIEATGPPRAFGRVAGGVAIAGDIERLVVATASMLELRAVDGSSSHAVPLSADGVLDVALSANGQLVALGLRSGTVEIRSAYDGSLLARLVGHRERVASVAITEHGIWSASWDGDVRVWDRAALALPAAEALAAAEARFGLGLDDVTRR